MADGLLATIAPSTFEVIRTQVHAVGTASEAQIVAAMRRVWEELKIIIEASSAVPARSAAERRRCPLPGSGSASCSPAAMSICNDSPWKQD